MFLAQLYGIYLTVMGVLLIVRNRKFAFILNDFINNYAMAYIVGVFIFILGLVLVLSHNVWDGSWRTIITVLNWLILLKGLVYLFLSHSALSVFMRSILRVFNNKVSYVLMGIISVGFGLYLMSIVPSLVS